MKPDFDVVVVGAGAAGMMCAAVAAARGRRVLLVDHATTLGEKIRISGGGRCNFTNLHCSPAAFLSRNPHFCKAALAAYGARDFIALVERHRIRYHEKTLGQLFCDDSSQQVIDMLKAECDVAGVRWATPAPVLHVAAGPGADCRFEVTLGGAGAGTHRCASLVVATGGLSIPKIGATPCGYRLAEQFGLPVVPPKPALVPLAAPPEWKARFADLSGAAFDAIASCGQGEFREAVLITHRGLSGPAILQVSSYWQAAGGREPVVLDLFAGDDPVAWLASHRTSKSTLPTLLGERLPRRFAERWAEAGGWTQPLVQMSNRTIEAIAAALRGWEIRPSGTLGYEKAEVTLGGVDTDALSQRTMESRKVPGLYFIGEVVDVTGWLGGYNFQWAWSSGHAAGLAA